MTMQKQCLVTGATGLVGLNLVDSLTRQGWNVLALSRKGSKKQEFLLRNKTNVRVVEGDLNNNEDMLNLQLLLEQKDIDTLFHLCLVHETTVHPERRHPAVGGYTPEGAEEHLRLNMDAMENVIRLASQKNVRRTVYCSSWSSYGIRPQGQIFDETFPSTAYDNKIALGFFGACQQSIPYMVGKRECEQALQKAVETGRIREAVILQPASIFGPYGRDAWSQLFRKLLETNGNIPGLPGSSSFCDARDLADAFVAAATKGPGKGEAYLIGGTNATNLEMLKEMSNLVGVPAPRKATPARLIMGISRWNELLLRYFGDRFPWITRALSIKADVIGCPFVTAKLCQEQGTYSNAAQQVLGYRPRPLNKILKSNYDWLVEQGDLPQK